MKEPSLLEDNMLFGVLGYMIESRIYDGKQPTLVLEGSEYYTTVYDFIL